MAHSIPSDDYYDRQNSGSATLVTVSAWFGVVIILVTAVGYSFGTPFDPSPTKPLVDLMQFGLVALILASVISVILKIEEGFGVTAVPLFINIGTLVIVQLVPFGVLWEEIRFQSHYYQYLAIEQKVAAGEWQPDGNGMIHLPASQAHLSADDGRLWASKTSGTAVFFVTDIRGPQQFAGYFHASDGRPPQSGEFQGQWSALIPKTGGWYYAISQ